MKNEQEEIEFDGGNCPFCESDLISNIGENYICNECSQRWEEKQ